MCPKLTKHEHSTLTPKSTYKDQFAAYGQQRLTYGSSNVSSQQMVGHDDRYVTLNWKTLHM